MDSLILILDYIKFQVEINYYFSIFFLFIFLLIYNSFSIPGNTIFMAASGYFFGIFIGYLISILTIVFGSLLFFIFSSFFLKKFSPKTLIKYSNKVDVYISNSSIEYLIIFRMIPGPPLFLQNLILSFLNVPKIKFIFSSLIGFTPLVFLLVFFGHQLTNFDNIKNFEINDIFSFKILIFVFLFLLFLILRIYLKKKKK